MRLERRYRVVATERRNCVIRTSRWYRSGGYAWKLAQQAIDGYASSVRVERSDDGGQTVTLVSQMEWADASTP